MIINKPINIDANNVRFENVKIKWEVGKAYRTRDGRRAVMREQKHNIIKLILMNENESYVLFTVDCLSGRSSSSLSCDLDIIGPWEEEADADLYDYQNGKAKAEQKAKVQYVPENIRIAGPVMQREKINDINTPDNRRPRVSLRTDAQIMHERAVLRLKQHKLARWGKAAPVRLEQEL